MTDERLSELFSALGEVHRLRALRFIADRGQGGADADEAVCACHVQDHLELSQPATSYHLKVLREAGLVTAEKRGRWVHYRVAREGIAALRDFATALGETAAGRPEAAA